MSFIHCLTDDFTTNLNWKRFVYEIYELYEQTV